MYVLKHTTPESHKPYTATVSVTMELEDEASLDEMRGAFDRFLAATGYGYPFPEEEEDV